MSKSHQQIAYEFVKAMPVGTCFTSEDVVVAYAKERYVPSLVAIAHFCKAFPFVQTEGYIVVDGKSKVCYSRINEVIE